MPKFFDVVTLNQLLNTSRRQLRQQQANHVLLDNWLYRNILDTDPTDHAPDSAIKSLDRALTEVTAVMLSMADRLAGLVPPNPNGFHESMVDHEIEAEVGLLIHEQDPSWQQDLIDDTLSRMTVLLSTEACRSRYREMHDTGTTVLLYELMTIAEPLYRLRPGDIPRIGTIWLDVSLTLQGAWEVDTSGMLRERHHQPA